MLSFHRTSPFDLSEPPSVAEGPVRVRPLIHIDRALVHASLSTTLFSLSCRRRHRSVIAPGRRGGGYTTRRRPKPIPIASTHRCQQRRCIPHNVFARPRLYDTANNRSWCQADILRMPRTAVRYTRKSRYIRQNKGKQSSRRALRGSIRNQETTQEATNGRVTRPLFAYVTYDQVRKF